MDGLGIPIVPRVPVVTGVNDTPEDIAAIADFVATLENARELVLLPFHRLAEGKYQSLGKSYRASGLADARGGAHARPRRRGARSRRRDEGGLRHPGRSPLPGAQCIDRLPTSRSARVSRRTPQCSRRNG